MRILWSRKWNACIICIKFNMANLLRLSRDWTAPFRFVSDKSYTPVTLISRNQAEPAGMKNFQNSDTFFSRLQKVSPKNHIHNGVGVLWRWPTAELTSHCTYTYIHWASKETYHFFKATLTKIYDIRINKIWTQALKVLGKSVGG